MTDSGRDPFGGFYQTSLEPAALEPTAPSALLCIDLQGLDASPDQGLFADFSPEDRAYYFERLESRVLPNVARLQRAYRDRGQEVIHVRIQSLTRDGRDRGASHKRLGLLAPPGSPGARFLPRVAPRGDEIIVNKTSSGVFESTSLEFVLRNLRIESLVMVGVYTNECVSTAARVASDLGFFVTVVDDACAAVTEDLHRNALATLRDRYARVLDTEEALRQTVVDSRDSDPPRAGDEAASGSRAVGGPRRSPRRRVVLLGGGAFASGSGDVTMAGQFRFAEEALERIAALFETDEELLLAHGNGPQVGHMLTRVEAALGESYALPLEVCVAETEGELGYVLQQTLHNVLEKRGVQRSVVSVVTQTIVDEQDPALDRPTKPIGPVYAEARARELEEQGYAMREEEGGWRRIVASPEPTEIIELDVLDSLLRGGVIVCAAGGGGIPVVRGSDGRLQGIEGVVDKDLSGALMASQLGAEELVILTSVPCAYLDFGRESQRPLRRTTPAELEALQRGDHFAPGTMAPKIEAARRFAQAGGTTIITDVASLEEAIAGRAGTTVSPDPD